MFFSMQGKVKRAVSAVAMATTIAFVAADANAETAGEIDAGVSATLDEMVRTVPGSGELLDDAVAALVIPEVTKATFIVGGAYGEGALLSDGAISSYWSYTSASIGYQIGAQETRQVMLFMTEDSLDQFLAMDGFEIGADFEVTVIDGGGEVAVDTTQDRQPVIVIVFDREGLLGGASLQGGKYSQIVR